MSTVLNGSLVKAFAVLDLISDQRPQITAASVADELQMSPATAHRYLVTLESLGLLSARHRGVYGLGHQIVRLGQIAERTNPLKKIVLPIIEKLSQQLGESVMAGRPAQDSIVCMATASAVRAVSVHIQVGRQLDLHNSAQGKIWVAYLSNADRAKWVRQQLRSGRMAEAEVNALELELSEIQRLGYARNRGETEPDIGAVAVPVWNGQGALELTLSAFGMISRFSEPREAKMVAALKQAAAEITEALAPQV